MVLANIQRCRIKTKSKKIPTRFAQILHATSSRQVFCVNTNTKKYHCDVNILSNVHTVRLKKCHSEINSLNNVPSLEKCHSDVNILILRSVTVTLIFCIINNVGTLNLKEKVISISKLHALRYSRNNIESK